MEVFTAMSARYVTRLAAPKLGRSGAGAGGRTFAAPSISRIGESTQA